MVQSHNLHCLLQLSMANVIKWASLAISHNAYCWVTLCIAKIDPLHSAQFYTFNTTVWWYEANVLKWVSLTVQHCLLRLESVSFCHPFYSPCWSILPLHFLSKLPPSARLVALWLHTASVFEWVPLHNTHCSQFSCQVSLFSD